MWITCVTKKMFGDVFGTLLSVFITVSCLGTMNGLMMANVRSIYSLAVRGHGPKPALFASVDETTKMPINSAMLGCLLAIVWMVYYFGANVAGAWFGPFCFDSGELPIITLYAMLGLVSGVYAHPNPTSHERYIRSPGKYIG